MVKTAQPLTGKSDKSLKRDSNFAFGDEEENSPVSSGSTGSSMDNNRNFDHLVSRCFIYAEMPTVTDRIVPNVKTGVGEIKRVFNGTSTNPLGVRSALTIWGHNADNYGAYITYVCTCADCIL